MTDLERAKRILEEEAYSCVLVRGETVLRCEERGIRSLLLLIAAHSRLEGFAAADRIVGKAAALLYEKLGVREVYAQVMSRTGKETLERFGIAASHAVLTDRIVNRTGDGCCPMEQTVSRIDDPEEAYLALCAKTGIPAGFCLRSDDNISKIEAQEI